MNKTEALEYVKTCISNIRKYSGNEQFIAAMDIIIPLAEKEIKLEGKGVGLDYMGCWYQDSIDGNEAPVWTDEHLVELLKDFILIPKEDL